MNKLEIYSKEVTSITAFDLVKDESWDDLLSFLPSEVLREVKKMVSKDLKEK